MWYIHTMEYYAAKKEIITCAATWMDLQTVIQSEVRKKEKNKSHILMCICGV